MANTQLLTSLTSPFGRIARILIAEHGLTDIDIEVVNPWKDRTPLEGISPLSKIPVLLLEDGTPIVDSWVIADFLDSQSDQPFAPADPIDRVKTLAACAVCHDALNSGTIVVGSSLAGCPLPDKLVEWHFGKAHGAFSDIDRRLADGEFGKDGQFGMLDVTVVATIGFFEYRLKDDFGLAGRFPKLFSWFEDISSSRSSVQDTVPPQA